MKNRIAAFLLAAALLLCGCAGAEARETGITFTDSTGAVVTLPCPPEKVAVLYSSFAETWMLAGGQVAVTVGEAVQRGFAPEDAILVDEGAGHTTVNLERLIAEAPDLVIGSTEYPCQQEAAVVCREAGIPFALFRQDSAADYLFMLRSFCDILGREDRWAQYGASVEAEMNEISAGMPLPSSPKVLLLRAGSSARSTKAKGSEDTTVGAMLRELGVTNIADACPVLLDGLSMETVLAEDPDWILISTMGDEAAARAYCEDLFCSEGWAELTAIRSGRVVFLDKTLFHFKPNARWPEAWRTLMEIFEPEMDRE